MTRHSPVKRSYYEGDTSLQFYDDVTHAFGDVVRVLQALLKTRGNHWFPTYFDREKSEGKL